MFEILTHRLTPKVLRDFFALRSCGPVCLRVGYKREGEFLHKIGIPNSNEWIADFKRNCHPLKGIEIHLNEGVRPHLKGIEITAAAFASSREWKESSEDAWVFNGEAIVKIREWEREVWLDARERSLEEHWRDLLKWRTENPRDSQGRPLLIGRDQNCRSLEILETSDGSKTLRFSEMNETYHSPNGAYEEAIWVFIQRGFDFVNKHLTLEKPLKILEIGLGTGLNAFLTLDHSESTGRLVEYVGIEPYPLEWEWVRVLEYNKFWAEKWQKSYEEIHQKVEVVLQVAPHFKLKKMEISLEEMMESERFDLIYFDAFAPDKQMEIWSLENLQKCFRMLKNSGVLVSYCAKGDFKRNLKTAGFEVQSLPGPPGRREMVRALKKSLE